MLNFVGDVGALNSVLTSIGTVLLLNVMRLDLTLENDYLTHVFRKRVQEKSIMKTKKLNLSYCSSFISQLAPLAYISSNCSTQARREKKIRNKLVKRMERELDIAHFIRNQILLRSYIRAGTTKNARLLARHNYALMKPDSNELSSTPDSGSDFDRSKFKPANQQ